MVLKYNMSMLTALLTRIKKIKLADPLVPPNQPLHIMHRGNNRQDIFESEEDMARIISDIRHSLAQSD